MKTTPDFSNAPAVFEQLPPATQSVLRGEIADILAPSMDRGSRAFDLALRIRDSLGRLVVILKIPEEKAKKLLELALAQEEDLNPPPAGGYKTKASREWMNQQTS